MALLMIIKTQDKGRKHEKKREGLGFYVGEYCRSMREGEGFDFMSTEGSMGRLLKVSNCPPSPSFPSPPPLHHPEAALFPPSLATSPSIYIYVLPPPPSIHQSLISSLYT